MPLTTNELIGKYDYILGFKRKEPTDKLTEQDKKHLRIFAVIKLLKEGQLDYVVRHDFIEKIEFDKNEQMAYYKIKIIRNKRKETKYADC